MHIGPPQQSPAKSVSNVELVESGKVSNSTNRVDDAASVLYREDTCHSRRDAELDMLTKVAQRISTRRFAHLKSSSITYEEKTRLAMSRRAEEYKRLSL